MTVEEIHKALCVWQDKDRCHGDDHDYECPSRMARYLIPAITQLIAEEREACAKIAEHLEPEAWPYRMDTGHMWRREQGDRIADAIRATPKALVETPT
jgi:hypothetical protein